jgi:DNA-binding response OmpR family regulator
MTPPTTLIIAEDDPETLQMLDTYLRAQGYQVVPAFHCQELEETAISQHADVILMDLHLPGDDPLGMAKRLCVNRRTAGIPILILSDPMEREDRLEALSAGIEDFIPRPFDLQELGLRVRNAVERSHRSRKINPVTELPEGPPVDEALQRMLCQPEWSLADIRVLRLDAFRAARGFSVANDALGSIGKFLQQAAAQRLKVGVLVGHLNFDEFVVLSDLPALDEFIMSTMRGLAETARAYNPVYSSLDPDNAPPELSLQYRLLSSSDGTFDTRESLLAALDQTPLRTR